jgi:flagellar biosynthesis protein FliR
MNLDLRIPIGMMFSMVGAVLTAFGLATRSHPELYTRSLGINANLWWGLVVLIFGIVVLSRGRRGQAKIEQKKLGKQ